MLAQEVTARVFAQPAGTAVAVIRIEHDSAATWFELEVLATTRGNRIGAMPRLTNFRFAIAACGPILINLGHLSAEPTSVS